LYALLAPEVECIGKGKGVDADTPGVEIMHRGKRNCRSA
jgi:hypothetical protein